MTARLGPHLEALYQRTDMAVRLRSDPVAFPHRYQRREDIEIAAVLASQLAYGRVSLFWPVLESLFDALDRRGGPEAAVLSFGPTRADEVALAYRFHKPPDLAVLLQALRRVLESYGSIEAAFSWSVEDRDAGAALHRGTTRLRRAMEDVAASYGQSTLTRGMKHFLCSPSGGSACKRWCMFLRWMCRPPTEGVDFGLWSLPTAKLVIPLDTHVLRLSRFLGLTDRKTGSWRTAQAITGRLAELDPEDPVRFDFALAHLGISGACLGRREPTVCRSCPLDPVCVVS